MVNKVELSLLFVLPLGGGMEINMYFEDTEFRLIAPDVDRLLRYFDRKGFNSSASTKTIFDAAESLFKALEPLAPLKENDEVKSIWVRIPRGYTSDYAEYEELKDLGEVDSYEEFEKMWNDEYPDEFSWYKLEALKSFNRDGSLRYYGINFGHKSVISALTDTRWEQESSDYEQEAAAILCRVIIPAVDESIALLKEGKYNDMVEASLPYQFRTGIIKRSDFWKADPKSKEYDYDNLSEETVARFKALLKSGVNDVNSIGRIKNFTANTFFRACKAGYISIGKECEKLSLSELYMRYSDGRDEGLTGTGHGLNEGPGIDFDSPSAWDEWYFDRKRGGGHPWEVVPGGNSTHVELYVCNDRDDLERKHRCGEISKEDYIRGLERTGYYFAIAGSQRQFEAVSFYIALTDEGFPVVIRDAEELLARFEATDYIGIVPHHYPTRYCESLFPKKYGDIIDFYHAYKDEDVWFDMIEWLPEEPSELAGVRGGNTKETERGVNQ